MNIYDLKTLVSQICTERKDNCNYHNLTIIYSHFQLYIFVAL